MIFNQWVTFCVGGFLFFLATTAYTEAFDEQLNCVLEPNTEIELSAPVYGVLSEVSVQRGDWVNKGQVVASLMSGTEMAAVELAKARMEFGQRKSVRNEELYQEELISIHEKDEIDTEVLLAKLQLRQAKEQLKLRKVISSIDGLVVERNKDPGEYVEQEAFLTVVNLDPLYAQVVAPAEYVGRIKKGMPAEVKIIGSTEETYQAKVSLVDQTVDAASGTIRIRLSLKNPKNAIVSGLKCLVSFK
jgi:RND family efflux transporter MFP subunit